MELSNHTNRSFLLDLPFGCKVHCNTILPILIPPIFIFDLYLLLVSQFDQGKKYKKLFWVPAIAPLLSVIVATFFVYITRADREGVQIVSLLCFLVQHVSIFVLLNCLDEHFKVHHIKQGINPSSAHEIFFSGPFVAKGFKIGVIAGLVALTVHFI